MLNTLAKATSVLNLFTVRQPEWGTSEVARKLEYPKATVSEIMSSLTQEGLLSRTSKGKYRLGWRLFELSQALLETSEFCIEARRAMQELVERWGETTHLCVLEGTQVLYVEKLQATPAVQILLSRVGARLPAHCNAAGKTLLAYLHRYDLNQLYKGQELTGYTPKTITDLPALAAELEQICQQGYAYDREEISPGLCCVAAPIRDFSGEVIAAISLSLPSLRFYPQQSTYTDVIVKTAQQISKKIGYQAK
jgi:IclR family KDG regulon transcriptional repressor